MTCFNVIEKQQKSCFCLQLFLLNSSLQTQKSTFPAKFSPSPSLVVNVFALIRCPGRATASRSSAYWPYQDFQHHHRTACREIATISDSVRSLPHVFHSAQPLRSNADISRLLCSSVVATSKICRSRSRNSSRVESQG